MNVVPAPVSVSTKFAEAAAARRRTTSAATGVTLRMRMLPCYLMSTTGMLTRSKVGSVLNFASILMM